MPATKSESGYSSRSSSESANGNMMAKIRQTNLFDFYSNNDDKSKIQLQQFPLEKSLSDVNKNDTMNSSKSNGNDENTEINSQNDLKIPKTCYAKVQESMEYKTPSKHDLSADFIDAKVDEILNVLGGDENDDEWEDIEKAADEIVLKVQDTEKDTNFKQKKSRRKSICVEKLKFDKSDSQDDSQSKFYFKIKGSRRRKSVCVDKFNFEKNEPKEISYKKYVDESAPLPDEDTALADEDTTLPNDEEKRLVESDISNKVEDVKESHRRKSNSTVKLSSDKANYEFSLVNFKRKRRQSVAQIENAEKVSNETCSIDPFTAMLIRFGIPNPVVREKALKHYSLRKNNPNIDNEIKKIPRNKKIVKKRLHEDSTDDVKNAAKRQKITETEFKVEPQPEPEIQLEPEPEPEPNPGVIEEVIEDIWYVTVMTIENEPVVRFTVKWDGYAPTENTYEPYEHVAHAEILQDYVKRKFETHQEKIEEAIEKLSAEAVKLSEIYAGKSKKVLLNRFKQFDVLQFRCNILAYIYTYEEIPHYCLFMRHLRAECVLYKYYMKHEKELESNKLFITKVMKKEKNSFKMTVENKHDFEPMPHFEYVKRVEFPKIQKIKQGCACEGGCIGSLTCCPNFLGLKPVYDIDSRLCASSHQMIVECNDFCYCDDSCPNKPKRTKFGICVFKTLDRGWALRALENIPAATFVLEYTGELIKMAEAKKRTREYKKLGVTYLFDLDYNERNEATYSLDATKKGNLARFINHSCSPNLQTWPSTSCNDSPETHRLYYFSLRPIRAGEELTVDYSGGVIRPKMNPPKDAIPCKCNSDKCRGFIF